MNMLSTTINGEPRASGRQMTSPIGDINLDEALVVQHLANGVKRYTFKMEKSEDLAFSNLILKETEAGDVSGYFIRYMPDVDWLIANNGKVALHDFTGYVALSLLSGLDYYYVRVDNGKGYSYALPLEEDENGRLLGDCVGSGGSSGSGGGSGITGSSFYWSSDMAMDFTGGTTYGIVEEETQPLKARFKISGYNTFRARMLCDESTLPESDACTDDTSADAAEEICDPSPIGVLESEEDIDLLKIIIADLEEHPCTKEIFQQIQELENDGIRTIINRFAEEESQFLYRINIGGTSSNNSAETIPISYLVYQTTYNIDYLNTATTLSIARTLLHEAIHAYIHSYLVGEALIDPNSSRLAFTYLWNIMIAQKYGDPLDNIEIYHHEEMARGYKDEISSSLKELFGSKYSEQLYEDLAWGALIETDLFTNTSLLNDDDRERIVENNINEDTNTNSEGNSCD